MLVAAAVQHVDVQKLIKARPLDNMEFMQWFKRYFDDHTGGGDILDYDPVQRRAASKTGDLKGSRCTLVLGLS